MSRENVELVMRAIEAVTRQPEPDWDTANQLFHPEHVWVPAGFDDSEVKGRGAYREWQAATESLMSLEAHQASAVDIGPRTVLAVLTMHIRGASSDAETDQRMWFVMTLAAGRITRSAAYTDPAEAMRATLEE